MAFPKILCVALFVIASASLVQGRTAYRGGQRPYRLITYYLQQQFGVNELGMVPPARPPVNGTNTGFGVEVVYEFTMTAEQSPQSEILGYVRGTAIAVNNTAASTTFFVQNVIHYDDGFFQGTLTQQGEAIFASLPWEFAITGGTGAFRNAYGFNVGRFISSTPTPNGNLITTFYEASVFFNH
ncbi:hypothetical protein KP509_01G072900 [Ceratopteris richardii]|uniref:Dirigent protein n=1 Tax=Ceratopteris richardii TaxID=49495 RepID=A0A8T2VLX4_CERRI|nr:hypothetical protein KP509_01G072900 [Ceratopteris richardii]